MIAKNTSDNIDRYKSNTLNEIKLFLKYSNANLCHIY